MYNKICVSMLAKSAIFQKEFWTNDPENNKI